MKTGVQLSSLRPLLTSPDEVGYAFSVLAAMGCRDVQIQWIDPSVPVEFVAQALREYGLVSHGVQDYASAVMDNPSCYVEMNRLTGGTWLTLSRIPAALSPTAFARELRSLQRDLEGSGQLLSFHPVLSDYTSPDLSCPVEELLRLMPDLSLCLDLYHLNRAGFSMPAWIRDHAGRISSVHFKDADASGLVPAGRGDTDWRQVVPACLSAGVSCAFVEQETWSGDPFRCLKEALDWLRNECDAAEGSSP